MIRFCLLYKKNKGFTIIELLIVVAIISILAAIVIPDFGALKRNQVFKSTVNEVNSLVQKARNNAISSVDSSSYGVHFESGQVVLFKGNTYGAPDTTLETITLESSVSISSINFTGGVAEIVFARGTGIPNVSGEISITSSTDVRTISVNGTGSISVYVPSATLNTLGVALVGNGTVTSNPSGINCGATCSYDFNSLVSVSLTPSASSGYAFSAWSGDCTGSSTCVVNMSVDKNITATFITATTYDLDTTVVGSGSITSSPGFINCNPTCTDSFISGSSVVLTATPGSGYAFSGWSGGGCTGTSTCNLSMTSDKNVTATFTAVSTDHTVTPIAGSNGSVSPSTPQTVAQGGTTFFDLSPSSGYVIGSVGGTCPAGSLVGNRYTTGSIVADCNVMFNFPEDTAPQYLVQAIINNGETNTEGSVVSTPSGIDCPNVSCNAEFSDVTLEATASPGFVFMSWVGDYCDGETGDCVLNDILENIYLNAMFGYRLNVTKSGTGTGTVTSPPYNSINCGATCSYDASVGGVITLQATHDVGSVFAGWTGDCSGTGSCVVTMDSAKNVNAIFNLAPTSQISLVGSSSVGGISMIIPTHQAGDLLLMFAYRDGVITPPTVPVGWTTIGTPSGSNTNSSSLAYKIASGSGTASGTWTGATGLTVQVLRGVNPTTPIGANADNGIGSTTVTYPALTLNQTNGTSWVLGFAGHKSPNTTLETPPTGMTNNINYIIPSNIAEVSAHGTNSGVSSWIARSVSVGGTSAGWRARTVEIISQ